MIRIAAVTSAFIALAALVVGAGTGGCSVARYAVHCVNSSNCN